MFSGTIAVDWPVFIAVLAGLLLFGCGYAWFVYGLGERKSGYIALFVAVGVLVTLGGLAIISWQAAILALVYFAASGSPMIAGEIILAMRSRDRAIREHRERAQRYVDGMERDD